MAANFRRARQRRHDQPNHQPHFGFDGFASTPTLVSDSASSASSTGPSSSFVARVSLRARSADGSDNGRGFVSRGAMGVFMPGPDADAATGRRAAMARRVFAAMRRTNAAAAGLSKKGRPHSATSSSALFSTPEERQQPPPLPAASTARTPSVRQIAMGLHTSRTPHLKHARASPSAGTAASSSATRVTGVGASPLRSSLKNTVVPPSGPPSLNSSATPSLSPSSGSSSTLAMSGFRARFDKFLGIGLGRSTAGGGGVNGVPLSSTASLTSSSSEGSDVRRRKTVRFISIED